MTLHMTLRLCAQPGCTVRLRPANPASLCFQHDGSTPQRAPQPVDLAAPPGPRSLHEEFLRRLLAHEHEPAPVPTSTPPPPPRTRAARPRRASGPHPALVDRADLDRRILRELAAGPLTSGEVQARLGLTRKTAYRALSRLRRAGRVVSDGRASAAVWRLVPTG